MAKKHRIVGRWLLGPGGFRRPLITGGGGGSQPRVNGNPTTTVVQSGDPSLAAMNKLVTDQLQATLPQYGGLQGLTNPRPANQMDFGSPAGPEHSAINSLQAFYSAPQTNQFEQGGLGIMGQAADPTQALSAGNDYMSRILGPMAINQLTAAGQGRSGAVGEALANAASGIALPILQQQRQAQTSYGGTLANFGGQLFGRDQGALGQLYQLAAAPRMDQTNASNTGMDQLLSMMARFPVNSGQGTSTTSNWIPSVSGGEPPVWQQVMGGMNSVMSLADMVGMMCWVAEALFAKQDPRRFLAAFYQVNFAPKGWLARQACRAYRRYGRSWAKSRVALTVLRPIFNRVALAGARTLGVSL